MPRKKNTAYRTREHLTVDEVNELIHAAACRGRHQHRDSTLILMLFRHGLRASEATALKWDAIIWKENTIWINRLKGSESGEHPLIDDEVEALKELRRLYPNPGNYIFVGEGSKPLSVDSLERVVSEAGKLAGLGKIHPHQLRHACGYHLVNQDIHLIEIQEYLGHKNIENTAKYTKLKSSKFKKIQWG